MGNKERGSARTGGDVEEKRVVGRGHVLPEEGEPHNHLHERTAHDKELLNGKGAASCLELPSSVRREVEMEEIGMEEVETALDKMKKARRQGQMKCG